MTIMAKKYMPTRQTSALFIPLVEMMDHIQPMKIRSAPATSSAATKVPASIEIPCIKASMFVAASLWS